jgi:hypothetical protein
MPHVVIEGVESWDALAGALGPFIVNDGAILKVTDVFTNQRGTSMLLEAVVIEPPRSVTFFIQLSKKGPHVTVRLLPATDPEHKTNGVKQILGLVAQKIKAAVPHSRYGKTNLAGFLGEAEPDASKT